MFAYKLIAAKARYDKTGNIAGRDFYDIHKFFVDGLPINTKTIQAATGKKYEVYLGELSDFIDEKLADKYFCNFSLFQSLPDAWAINQVFPILPISGLTEKPRERGVLQDITCDSDGKIDDYVDSQGVESTLPLLPYQTKQPYYLGIFLVGAYQEILGDMHNLFGDTNSVHVELLENGQYQLVQPLEGDTVSEVLRYVHFDTSELLQSYRGQLAQAQGLTTQQRQAYLEELRNGLQGYTYLED